MPSLIEFRSALRDRVQEIATATVGPGTDPTDYIKTFDSYLHDVKIEALPYMVITVRTAELNESGEMGGDFDLYRWTLHIYYLDTNPDYPTGDDRRNVIMGKLEKALELDRFLGNLRHVDDAGNEEYVIDSRITTILFDSSGENNYHSFVSELYLEVDTARS